MTGSGGTLHGAWNVDHTISTSDRRLKENITPILETLKQSFNSSGSDPEPLHWVLRQLRPVSYNFKTGADAKHIRFGFLADEMEKVLPQVVRQLPETAPSGIMKGIVYTDLIAVLTAIMRNFGQELQDMKDRVHRAEQELDRLDLEEDSEGNETEPAESAESEPSSVLQ